MATLTSIKALITALRQATARRSVSPENVGYIMQLLAEHIGDNESAQQLLRDDVTSLRADLDALDHDNATEAIESFREILAFLDGCKDDETLLAKLTEIKGLITEEASTRLAQIGALDEELDGEMQNCRDADEALGARIDDEAHIRLSEDEALAGKITRLDKRDKHKVINLEQDDDIEGPELVVPAPTKYATLEAALEKVKTNHEVLFGSILTYYDGLKYVRYQYCPELHKVKAEDGAEAQSLTTPQASAVDDPVSWRRLPDISDMAEEAAARKEVDARLEQSCIKVSADTTLEIADAADTAVQEWVPAESRTTCAAMLTALAADGGYFEGGLPMLVARNADGTIAEMMVYNAENTGGDVFYDITNYVPLSLATLAATRQPRLSSSTDILVDNAKLTLTEEAKHAVFDDLWLQAVRTAGSIDYTDAAAPYVCNGIHHTYKEAKYLYDQGHPRHGCLANFYKSCPIKTNLPPHLSAIDGGTYMFSGCSSLTKVNMSLLLPLLATFANCTSLKYIECYSPVAQTGNIDSVYLNCSALQTIEVRTVFPRDFDVADSPLLDLTTFQGFVSKYDGSKAITIYVHPDVYAKLTDTDQIVNAQWCAVMTQAVNKKIAFATKE